MRRATIATGSASRASVLSAMNLVGRSIDGEFEPLSDADLAQLHHAVVGALLR
jgi:hypothetical protein